ALIAPILPLIVIAVLRVSVGLGKAADSRIDPVAAAALGFIAASFYAAILTNPRRTVDILAGALVEGIQDVAGVLFLFMGIGMLVAATTHPAAADFLRETLSALLPSSLTGLFLFFALFAPAALYRGPLNLYGMGAGVAALLMGMGTFPAAALCGMFIAVGYIQTLADPTNSHNTWIGGFVGVDTAAILRRVLPYGWAMCLLMLAYAFLLSRG
ncbi:MAG: transporter, partial [Schwartzia sp.]|nr:transporter [Schwartzia sp. (in: firmicutes)]